MIDMMEIRSTSHKDHFTQQRPLSFRILTKCGMTILDHSRYDHRLTSIRAPPIRQTAVRYDTIRYDNVQRTLKTWRVASLVYRTWPKQKINVIN